jgi:hypothetical protein
MNPFDRLKSAIRQLVQMCLPTINYSLAYPAKVNSQNSDGTLDVTPDDPRMPGMQGVKIDTGLPDLTVEVQAGSRVLIAFENGSPAAPFAGLWQGSVVTKLVFHASGSPQPVARKNDPVLIALSDLQQFVFTAPSGGGPCVVSGAVVGTPATAISDGSAVVSSG